MARECRKCGEKIPCKIKIDGKKKSLQNRKFCLTCSPWGMHNTKSDDPAKPAIKKGPYQDWPEEKKEKHRQYVLEKGRRIKRELVEAKGGKCQICGYNRCIKALQFHHRDKSEKKFELSINMCWSKSREAVLAEAAKCDLLCAVCHIELEAGLVSVAA